ncbi:MAG: VanW family protein, partial [Clostridia bacterium]|nr:VanW family protein [Clostridia bacterium]
KKGLGGGNCQISSTLYNALLSVPTLVITERHAHSNYVPYIAKGKDAAVAYGSYDLKFRNDSGNDVKILSSTDGSSVTITLIAIKTI